MPTATLYRRNLRYNSYPVLSSALGSWAEIPGWFYSFCASPQISKMEIVRFNLSAMWTFLSIKYLKQYHRVLSNYCLFLEILPNISFYIKMCLLEISFYYWESISKLFGNIFFQYSYFFTSFFFVTFYYHHSIQS